MHNVLLSLSLIFAVVSATYLSLGSHAAREMARSRLDAESVRIFKEERKQYFVVGLFLLIFSVTFLNLA